MTIEKNNTNRHLIEFLCVLSEAISQLSTSTIMAHFGKPKNGVELLLLLW